MRTLFAALLALVVAATASAHDVGAMKVELLSTRPGVVRIQILADLDHFPSALRPRFTQALSSASWILAEGRSIPLGEPVLDEPLTDRGAPTSQRRLAYEVNVAPGAASLGWRTDLDVPEYLLVVGGGEAPPSQWLSGGQASELFDILAPGRPRSAPEVLGQYVALGFTHILPYGADHVLFVLTLFLASSSFRPLLRQVTAFTLAHTFTLALTMLDVFHVPSAIVEPLIAVSIIVLAAENLITKDLKPRRVGLVFAFGLLHGLGFAGVLTELGLPRSQFAPALVGFNLGVEAGQVAVLAAAFAAVGVWARRKSWYRARIVAPGSVALGLVAAFWTAQRLGVIA